jgi:hypothetical protein
MEDKTSALLPTKTQRCPPPHAQGSKHQALTHYPLRFTFHAHGTRHASPNQPNTRRQVVLRPKGGPLSTLAGRPVNSRKDQVPILPSIGSPTTKTLHTLINFGGRASRAWSGRHTSATPRRVNGPGVPTQHTPRPAPPRPATRKASAARVSYRRPGHHPNNPARARLGNTWRVPPLYA